MKLITMVEVVIMEAVGMVTNLHTVEVMETPPPQYNSGYGQGYQAQYGGGKTLFLIAKSIQWQSSEFLTRIVKVCCICLI